MSVFLHIKMDVAIGEQSFDEATQAAFPMEGAYRMLKLPTLQWKIWGLDPERCQASGFYLFQSRAAAEGYAHQAVRTLQERPGISNVTAQLWEIAQEQTRITHGPIGLPMIQDLAE